jgi:hypothetical protein
MLLSVDTQLLLIDTYSGQTTLLDVVDSPLRVSSPVLNTDADAAIYSRGLDVVMIQPLTDSLPQVLLPYNAVTGGLYRPFSWNSDGTRVLVGFASSGSRIDQLHALNVSDRTSETIMRYVPDERLDFAPEYVFSAFQVAVWNPIHDQWIALVISGLEYTDDASRERFGTGFGVLFNQITGERILVNQTFDERIFQ